MSDGLKSQYISYPFMQVADRPDWFKEVKDARIVATMEAGNLDTEQNGDNIQVILLGMTNSKATVEITCFPLEGATVSVPIYRESAVPTTQSFILVSDTFDIDAHRTYGNRLHPDCLTLLQNAPTVNGSTAGIIDFYNGTNLVVTNTQNGVLLYGLEGGGLGLYYQTIEDAYIKGLGLRSINGLSGDVWLDGSYPVRTRAVMDEDRTLVLTVTDDEVAQ